MARWNSGDALAFTAMFGRLDKASSPGKWAKAVVKLGPDETRWSMIRRRFGWRTAMASISCSECGGCTINGTPAAAAAGHSQSAGTGQEFLLLSVWKVNRRRACRRCVSAAECRPALGASSEMRPMTANRSG